VEKRLLAEKCWATPRIRRQTQLRLDRFAVLRQLLDELSPDASTTRRMFSGCDGWPDAWRIFVAKNLRKSLVSRSFQPEPRAKSQQRFRQPLVMWKNRQFSRPTAPNNVEGESDRHQQADFVPGADSGRREVGERLGEGP